MKILSLIFIILHLNSSLSQNSLGFGVKLNLSTVDNSNQNSKLKFNSPSVQFIGINSICRQNDSTKFNIGHTFEVGLSFLKFHETTTYTLQSQSGCKTL